MSVLIVVESQFGNTMSIARAVAAGLASTGAEVTVVRCGEAAAEIPDGVGLLLVGAPTHNLRLSSQASRTQAAARGATEGDGRGLADWIGRVQPRPDLPVVAFDTTTAGRFVGSAAKAAVKLLRSRGFRAVEQGQTFVVAGTSGPLRDGEEERARSWGTELAAVRA